VSSRRRTTTVFAVAGALLAGAAVWGVLMFRADAKRDGVDDAANRGPLTAEQYAAAVRIVQREVRDQKASLTSATAILRPGTVLQANVGPACTSGHLIRIRLLGRFPHIVTGGTTDGSGGRVTEVDIAADAATGRACELGVGTGKGHPFRRAADLMPALVR
jgi:hypothetical protein